MKTTSVIFRIFSFISITHFFACSSTPKVSTASVSEAEAKAWFQQYCSKGMRDLGGNLVIKANTKEFKGQFPASVHIEKSGAFQLEVTNIIGGTLLRLTSDSKNLEILVPSKPEYNQKGVTHYLGIELPILTALLLGDIPCPKGNGQNRMIFQTATWKWSFQKSDLVSGGIPVEITLTAKDKSGLPIQIELKVDEWNSSQNFAKKVTVTSPEGELKWTWRSRN